MNYIYLLRAGKSHYKVGVATSVKARVASLQTANPTKIQIVTTMLVQDAYKIEGELHGKLESMKADGGREWFKLEPEEAIDLAISIHQNPELDLKPAAKLRDILAIQADNQKRIEQKLSRVIALAKARIEQRRPLSPRPLPIPTANGMSHQTINRQLSATDEELVEKAKVIFADSGKGSTSLLQRELRIGYGRASRIMDLLEKEKFIDGYTGPYARRLLNK